MNYKILHELTVKILDKYTMREPDTAGNFANAYIDMYNEVYDKLARQDPQYDPKSNMTGIMYSLSELQDHNDTE